VARNSTTFLGYPMLASQLFEFKSEQDWWNFDMENLSEGETRDSCAITILLMIMRYRSPYLGFGGGFQGDPVHVRRNSKIILTATTFEELKQKLTDAGLFKDNIGLTLDYRFEVENDT